MAIIAILIRFQAYVPYCPFIVSYFRVPYLEFSLFHKMTPFSTTKMAFSVDSNRIGRLDYSDKKHEIVPWYTGNTCVPIYTGNNTSLRANL